MWCLSLVEVSDVSDVSIWMPEGSNIPCKPDYFSSWLPKLSNVTRLMPECDLLRSRGYVLILNQGRGRTGGSAGLPNKKVKDISSRTAKELCR